jgi:hypothetical protein
MRSSLSVLARRDHEGPFEPELREALPDPAEAGRHGGGAVAHGHPGRRREDVRPFEGDVEAVGGRKAPRRDERISHSGAAAPLGAHRECDPSPGLCPLDRLTVDLDALHPNLEPGGLHLEAVARRDGARPERAGHDGADAGEAERAVDVKARVTGGGPWLDLGGCP